MDIRHFFREKGRGFPLILLHGNEGDSSDFYSQIDYFSRNHRVIAIDTRGHGRTERGTAPFTIRQFADDLLCFMDDHRIEKADILGFSDGGGTAIIFALKYPERVNRLVLSGANLDTGGVEKRIQKETERLYREALKRAGKNRKAQLQAEMLGLLVNDPNIRAGELKGIKAPALVTAGTEDIILRKHTEKIAGNIPGAELAFIEGGHLALFENSDEFNRIAGDFLDKT